jgi:hypothetical protein
MRDWEGKAYDFIILWSNFIFRQRWFDYSRWGDFDGTWLPKGWYNVENLLEQLRNPWYKFFWWRIRYGG